MGRTRRINAAGAAGLALILALSSANTSANAVAPQETVDAVRRVLERLPYYGVFDFIVFRVNRGVVTLAGYAYQAGLKADAAMAVKRAAGVDEVDDRIEQLPASANDDRIRRQTFFRIYTDDFLSRYSPGGGFDVLRELRDLQRFPDMEPVGIYPIHIIVKNG